VTVYTSTVAFIYTGEHISSKTREQYLQAILRQNIGYFDKLGAGEITTRISADTNLIQEGISEKISLTLAAVASFLGAFIIGFVKSWKLTLILSCTFVMIMSIMGISGGLIVKFSKQNISSYAEGGTVAEEVLCFLRLAGTQLTRLSRSFLLFVIPKPLALRTSSPNYTMSISRLRRNGVSSLRL